MNTQPPGTFRCTVCATICGGESVLKNDSLTATVWTCSDANCGHPVQTISNLPLAKYLQKKLAPGIYIVHWRSVGYSQAAVGVTLKGSRWVAPTDWVAPSMSPYVWEKVLKVKEVPIENP